jgi:hypothetical protein
MSNNVKKNLIDTLNNLLDNNVSNNDSDQVGGKRYSQKEVDDMLMASLYNIMTLYQKSVSDTKMIKNQINQIMLQRSGVQFGGSRSYTRAEVDSVMTNSLQQIMGLYMQSENERHQLTKQLQQLQMGGVSAATGNATKNKNTNHSLSGAKVNTKASIKAVQDYLTSLMTGHKLDPNESCSVGTFKLLILNDLNSVPTDADKNSFGLVGKNNGGIATGKHTVNINYDNASKGGIDRLMEIFDNDDNTAGTALKLISKGNNTNSTNTNHINFNAGKNKASNVWKPTTDVLKLLLYKIVLKNSTDNTTEFDLSSNDKFIEQLDDKYKTSGTNNIETNKNNTDIKNVIQFIRGHLMEQLGKGIVYDLE